MALAEKKQDLQKDPTRPDEIAELFTQHSAWLKTAVRKMTSDACAEDVVQEAYIRLVRLPPSTEIRHPRALLLKISRNILRDRFRKASRDHRPPAADLKGHEAAAAAAPEQFETLVLKQTILALPEIYRDVFLLSRFGGMSYDQIAQARDISVKTVEWRMSRALAMCAARMRE